MSVLELGCWCRCRVLLEGAAAGQGAGQGAAVRVLCVLCFGLWCCLLGAGAAAGCCFNVLLSQCCVRLAGAAAGRHRRVLLSECCAR